MYINQYKVIFLIASVLENVSKLLYMPEEASLILHQHERSLVLDWQLWVESLACNLTDQSQAKQCYVQVMQDYNAQASRTN